MHNKLEVKMIQKMLKRKEEKKSQKPNLLSKMNLLKNFTIKDWLNILLLKTSLQHFFQYSQRNYKIRRKSLRNNWLKTKVSLTATF